MTSETPLNNNVPAREWLEKMADAEDGCDITAMNPEWLENMVADFENWLVGAETDASIVRQNVAKKNYRGPCGRA